MAKRPANSGNFAKGNKAGKHKNRAGGRPKAEAKQALRDLLTTPYGKEKLSLRDRALAALERALAGKGNTAVRAAELVLAYTDGQPSQKVEQSGELVVRVEYDD